MKPLKVYSVFLIYFTKVYIYIYSKQFTQQYNTSLNDLSTKLREHGQHAILSSFSSLPIPVLRILDIEANRFYDRNHQMYEAALLTRCFTQHALHPLIDSIINNKIHFIKIPFINKGIDFIDLPSIFQDKSVTSSIPVFILEKILSRLLFVISITNPLEI